MANLQNIEQLGKDQGKGVSGGDKLKMFLKVFSGEVLTAYTQKTVTMGRHLVRQIQHGKSASFPVTGRASAFYLDAGESLDDKRKEIKNTERIINIDGLLTSNVIITDIEDAMNHFEVGSVYSKELGNALAKAIDGAVFAEVANACNLDGAKDENIEGLGKPVLLDLGTQSTFTGKPATERGKEIVAKLAEAQAKFDANSVPEDERYFFCTPETYAAIMLSGSSYLANFSSISNLETGTLTKLCGFEIVKTINLEAGGGSTSTSGSTQKHAFPTNGDSRKVVKGKVAGLFFHRDAVGTVQLKQMSIEHARRAEYQADMIVARYSMGHGWLRPEGLGALYFNS